MNEKMQYASMLDLPVSTCNVSSRTIKKKKIKKSKKANNTNGEQLKQEVLDMVNAQEQLSQEQVEQGEIDLTTENQMVLEQEDSSSVHPYKPKKSQKFTLDIMQIHDIILLIGQKTSVKRELSSTESSVRKRCTA